jgi:hypothetical protein
MANTFQVGDRVVAGDTTYYGREGIGQTGPIEEIKPLKGTNESIYCVRTKNGIMRLFEDEITLARQ